MKLIGALLVMALASASALEEVIRDPIADFKTSIHHQEDDRFQSTMMALACDINQDSGRFSFVYSR